MAKRDKNRNPNAEGPRGPSVLEKLDAAESASVLKALVDHHPELRSEAEALAREVLGEVSLFSVADDVEDAVLQFDYDDLNSRAGSHSGGYVEPTEVAWELLEEAVEPFVSQMKRYLELGLEEQSREVCQGILLGLYRVRDGGSAYRTGTGFSSRARKTDEQAPAEPRSPELQEIFAPCFQSVRGATRPCPIPPLLL